MPSSGALPPLLVLLLTLGVVAEASALQGAGAADAVTAQDSIATLDELRALQRDFERFRESRIPLTEAPVNVGCDARIGRICTWYGGESDTDFPPEPVETTLARRNLLSELYDGWGLIRDPWITGQLVHYLVEDGSLLEAETLARQCDLVEPWWCSALLGYVLHIDGRTLEAQAAFDRAIAILPEREEERWTTPRYLFVGEGRERFEDADAAAREAFWESYWRLSDPLFLVEGNDHLTEHYARLVVVLNRENAENGYGIPWGDDLEEDLIRYGRTMGWSRHRGTPRPGAIPGFGDDRQVTGHHHPAGRGYLFPEDFLVAPAEIPPESWVTAPRAARSWHVPTYAPDFRALETQVARFRRGEEMLVVGAYQPPPPERDLFAEYAPEVVETRSDPFASRSAAPAPPVRDALSRQVESEPTGPLQTGLFLLPEGEGELFSVLGTEREGILTLTAPPGRYVSSLEVFDPTAQRAWRARQGVVQQPLIRGLVAVSDLLLLREEAPFPETLEEAIPLARPGIRIAPGENFTVVWEVYGLQVEDVVEVTLGFTGGRPGFLARVGEFLGIIEPERPIEVSFTDATPDEVQTLFRAIAMTLPDLAPGDYTLHLRLDLPGREPAIASRPVIVEG